MPRLCVVVMVVSRQCPARRWATVFVLLLVSTLAWSSNGSFRSGRCESETSSPGICLNRKVSRCSGGKFQRGKCPGPAHFQCCVKPPQPCRDGESRGTCLNTGSSQKCKSGKFVKGKCKGPAQIQCCLDAEVVMAQEKKKSFVLALSGGGARAFLGSLANIRGYGERFKIFDDVDAVASNSGSSWLMNRIMLEGKAASSSLAADTETPRKMYEDVVDQLAGRYDRRPVAKEEEREEVLRWLETSLQHIEMAPSLTMYFSYLESMISGKIGTEWWDYGKTRAVCAVNAKPGKCHPPIAAEKNRVQTVWTQQIVFTTSAVFYKKGTQDMYEYFVKCPGDTATGGETPLMLPMYLTIDSRESATRKGDRVEVRVPFLDGKACSVHIHRFRAFTDETLDDIMGAPGIDVTQQCRIEEYRADRKSYSRVINIAGDDIVRALTRHYKHTWTYNPGRVSAASAAFAGLSSSPELIKNALLNHVRDVSKGFPSSSRAFDFTLQIKRIATSVFNTLARKAKETFHMNKALRFPNPDFGYAAEVTLNGVDLSFSLIDGGYLDNNALSATIHAMQRPKAEKRDIVLVVNTPVNEAQYFDKIFHTLYNPHWINRDDSVEAPVVPLRLCSSTTKASAWKGCGISTEVFALESIVPVSVWKPEGAVSRDTETSVRTYVLKTVKNSFFGIRGGETYRVHVLVPSGMIGVDVMPKNYHHIKLQRQSGSDDRYTRMSRGIERRRLLKKFVDSQLHVSDSLAAPSHYRFKQSSNWLSRGYNYAKNKASKAYNHVADKVSNAYDYVQDKATPCALVYDQIVRKQVAKFVLAQTRYDEKRATEKYHELKNTWYLKHGMGAICLNKSGQEAMGYYRRMWYEVIARFFKIVPFIDLEQAGISIPDILGPKFKQWTGKNVPKLLRSCAEKWAERIVSDCTPE